MRRHFNRRTAMSGIFYIIGVIVVVGLVLGYFQLG
jgi:hypothetical protein